MFKNTSVEDISVDTLKTPFETIYVYFGPASRLKMDKDDAFIDGAYIWNPRDIEDEFSLSITLTREIDPQKVSQLHFLQRFARDIDFNFNLSALKGTDVTIREAFDEHFENSFEKMGSEGFEKLNAAWSDQVSSPWFSKSYEEIVASWKPDEKYRDPAIRPALNLVINAICYLAYDKREVVERYPDFAPERLVRQATTGATLKERNRGRSKLEDIGFRKVLYCGDTIERRIARIHQECGSGVSPHWRRGHWRHQAHGTGHFLRKLIWIEPVLVKEGSGEAGGHIYIPKPGKTADIGKVRD